jgi:hypothetical protein
VVFKEAIPFTGKNVHGPGNVTIRVEAVCGQSLLVDIRYYAKNPTNQKKQIRRTLCIHLDMADALTMADAIKNTYHAQANKNYITLIKTVVGTWHC